MVQYGRRLKIFGLRYHISNTTEGHLVSLVDAINKLLRWRAPGEANGS